MNLFHLFWLILVCHISGVKLQLNLSFNHIVQCVQNRLIFRNKMVPARKLWSQVHLTYINVHPYNVHAEHCSTHFYTFTPPPPPFALHFLRKIVNDDSAIASHNRRVHIDETCLYDSLLLRFRISVIPICLARFYTLKCMGCACCTSCNAADVLE